MSEKLSFRVWDNTAATWEYFDLKSFFDGQDGVEAFTRAFAGKDIDRASLSQGSGLMDRNGSEVFAGDLLKGREGSTVEVVFGARGFELINPSNGIRWPLAENSTQYEVVGNIYEHPDLVKE